MRIRGTRLASFGVPLGIVIITLVLGRPGPVGTPGAAGDPVTGSVPQGQLAAGSTRPGETTARPAGGPSESGGASPTPTPAVAGPTTIPSSVTTPGPTAHATAAPAPRPPSTPAAPPPPTAPPATAAPIPSLSACAIFPASNVWNRPVDTLAVASNSEAMIAAIGLDAGLHPDFSNAGGYGIPYNVVGASTPRSTVAFQYDDESDNVGYPIPASPSIEGGSDRHILMIDTNACTLYELFAASKSGSGWTAGSGATWSLGSNALRPDGWTSADAAGLPIFPGLVRHSEVAAGVIAHAIRFTAPQTCAGYVYPARHQAGDGSCDTLPPMGLRVRLKASVDIAGFGPQSQIILTALKRYGMLLADNGSPGYITGAPDGGWDDDELHRLGEINGSDFEVVDTTGFVNG